MKRHLQLLHSVPEASFHREDGWERVHFQREGLHHRKQEDEHLPRVASLLVAEHPQNATSQAMHSHLSRTSPRDCHARRGFVPAALVMSSYQAAMTLPCALVHLV